MRRIIVLSLVVLCLAGCQTTPEWTPPPIIEGNTRPPAFSSEYFEPCAEFPALTEKDAQGRAYCTKPGICEQAIISWVKNATEVYRECKGKVNSHITVLKSIVNKEENKKND